jgi:hypothetical protein
MIHEDLLAKARIRLQRNRMHGIVEHDQTSDIEFT